MKVNVTSLVSVVCGVQVIGGVRAVDHRCEWVRRQAVRRVDRCELLSEITHQLQQQAALCLARQQHLLSRAITRRGVRALRCDYSDERTYKRAVDEGTNEREQWRRQLWGTGARAPLDFQI